MGNITCEKTTKKSRMQIDLEKTHSELRCFFEPKGVAVIGASSHPEKIGHQVLKNLREGGVFSLVVFSQVMLPIRFTSTLVIET